MCPPPHAAPPSHPYNDMSHLDPIHYVSTVIKPCMIWQAKKQHGPHPHLITPFLCFRQQTCIFFLCIDDMSYFIYDLSTLLNDTKPNLTNICIFTKEPFFKALKPSKKYPLYRGVESLFTIFTINFSIHDSNKRFFGKLN